MKDMLFSLCSFDAVSGNEEKLLCHIAQMILPYADKLYFDRMGNLVCFKKGKEVPKKKVLFAAHADEVGLVVKHIEEDGTLLFCDIGIVAGSLPTRRVFVSDAKLPGVIGSKPIHLIPKSERGKGVKADDLYIDIGAESRKQAEKHVKVGDYVSFDSECTLLSEKIIKAKAIDDRAGCAMLIKLIMSDLAYDAHFVFTRREELGTLGAVSCANNLSPDICVVCEATTASDIYGTPDMKKVAKVGGGIVIPFMDGGTLYSRRLYNIATALADEKAIKWQTKTLVAGGTDARSFQREGHGCLVLGVAVPCRYIHSSAGVCSLEDVDAGLELCIQLEKVLGGIE